MTDKAQLRRHFSALRSSLAPAERAAAESAVMERLFSLPAWVKAPLVCGYVSMRGELDLMPVWKQAVEQGKTYALPVTVSGPRQGDMIFRALSGFTPHELALARFGLSEPTEVCPPLSLSALSHALILVPALAFDAQGFRLGYGGGYYDKFLAALREAGIPVLTVGLVFSICRTDKLPREPHDLPVDLIIDERRVTVPHGF
ncbi:MAG: 5-formyltetrahydrofolate cyclo-ligase [Clostridia bacterium]|nr:5-formyltetrahydrofolate cyclo-ligase [Clostridia bacterium]